MHLFIYLLLVTDRGHQGVAQEALLHVHVQIGGMEGICRGNGQMQQITVGMGDCKNYYYCFVVVVKTQLSFLFFYIFYDKMQIK